MNTSANTQSSWALSLLALLREMSALNASPVLQLLDDHNRIKTSQHYPEAGLLFGGNRWRAYYHCHADHFMHPQEHGHFHIFTTPGGQRWAHVAGLSIDAQSQPLRWFAVNRWVTDGPWLEKERLHDQLEYITEDDDACLTGRWLGIMLQLHRQDLDRLLEQRDVKLGSNNIGSCRQQSLDDRDIYTLAESDVDLQHLLEDLLLTDHATGNQTDDSLSRSNLESRV